MTEERAKREIGEWIVSATLAGTNEIGILAGVGERLNSAGVSLVRVSVATDLLDPMFDGRGVRWLRDQGGLEETFERDERGYHRQRELPAKPVRLSAPQRSADAPPAPRCDLSPGRVSDARQVSGPGRHRLLGIFRSRRRNIRLGVGEGITASWTTDAPDGFPNTQVELLAGIMPALTLAFMLRTTHRDARTLLTTYLGRHAAERVLAGNVVRGRAEPIRAVVWFSDLVGFTRISDNATPTRCWRF